MTTQKAIRNTGKCVLEIERIAANLLTEACKRVFVTTDPISTSGSVPQDIYHPAPAEEQVIELEGVSGSKIKFTRSENPIIARTCSFVIDARIDMNEFDTHIGNEKLAEAAALVHRLRHVKGVRIKDRTPQGSHKTFTITGEFTLPYHEMVKNGRSHELSEWVGYAEEADQQEGNVVHSAVDKGNDDLNETTVFTPHQEKVIRDFGGVLRCALDWVYRFPFIDPDAQTIRGPAPGISAECTHVGYNGFTLKNVILGEEEVGHYSFSTNINLPDHTDEDREFIIKNSDRLVTRLNFIDGYSEVGHYYQDTGVIIVTGTVRASKECLVARYVEGRGHAMTNDPNVTYVAVKPMASDQKVEPLKTMTNSDTVRAVISELISSTAEASKGIEVNATITRSGTGTPWRNFTVKRLTDVVCEFTMIVNLSDLIKDKMTADELVACLDDVVGSYGNGHVSGVGPSGEYRVTIVGTFSLPKEEEVEEAYRFRAVRSVTDNMSVMFNTVLDRLVSHITYTDDGIPAWGVEHNWCEYHAMGYALRPANDNSWVFTVQVCSDELEGADLDILRGMFPGYVTDVNVFVSSRNAMMLKCNYSHGSGAVKPKVPELDSGFFKELSTEMIDTQSVKQVIGEVDDVVIAHLLSGLAEGTMRLVERDLGLPHGSVATLVKKRVKQVLGGLNDTSPVSNQETVTMEDAHDVLQQEIKAVELSKHEQMFGLGHTN